MKNPFVLSLVLSLTAATFSSRGTWAQSEAQVLLMTGFAEITGRDIQGMQIPLGSGPFSLQLTVPSPFRTAPDNAGQQTFGSAFSEFWLNAPHSAFPRGGMTVQNTITAGREGEEGADFVSFFIGDCGSMMCSLPIDSVDNSEALGFEGMFGNALLSDGALGTEPFDSLGAMMQALDALDLATAQTMFNASYVPESLLGGEAGSHNGDHDIRFVSIDGTITDISIVPEPASGVLFVLCAVLLAVGKRGRRWRRRSPPRSGNTRNSVRASCSLPRRPQP